MNDFNATHRMVAEDQAQHVYAVGDLLERVGDSAFDGCSAYRNANNRHQDVLDSCVEAI